MVVASGSVERKFGDVIRKIFIPNKSVLYGRHFKWKDPIVKLLKIIYICRHIGVTVSSTYCKGSEVFQGSRTDPS